MYIFLNKKANIFLQIKNIKINKKNTPPKIQKYLHYQLAFSLVQTIMLRNLSIEGSSSSCLFRPLLFPLSSLLYPLDILGYQWDCYNASLWSPWYHLSSHTANTRSRAPVTSLCSALGEGEVQIGLMAKWVWWNKSHFLLEVSKSWNKSNPCIIHLVDLCGLLYGVSMAFRLCRRWSSWRIFAWRFGLELFKENFWGWVKVIFSWQWFQYSYFAFVICLRTRGIHHGIL